MQGIRDSESLALKTLRQTFGHAAFRGSQEEIVAHLAGGGDALVLMPTGGGKSLCYQVPSLLRPGTGIVVSPLIALMQDQVAALRQLGVRAAFLNSTLDAASAREVERALVAGDLDLLYVAPERVLTPRCLELLGRSRIALLAIDEACVEGRRWVAVSEDESRGSLVAMHGGGPLTLAVRGAVALFSGGVGGRRHDVHCPSSP